MTEKTIQKKVVGRNVVIALIIICVVLTVGLVGATAYYSSQINDKNKTISSRDSQINSLNSQIGNLQTWLNAKPKLH
jgi:flagellar basal body-associated protein FliL